MPNYPPQGNLSPTIVIGEIDDATLVIESEGIASNDNDTTFATSAAVKDYSDTTSISTTLTDGNILVGNGSNVATSVNPTGDIDISNAGVFSISSGVIIDADLASGVFANITGLGAQSQTLDLSGNNVDNVAVLISNAAIPATVGVIRMGTGEQFRWRNAANTLDIGFTFNDNLDFSGAGIQMNSNIITEPTITECDRIDFAGGISAAAGFVRFGNNDNALSWRNAANNADITLTVNASDNFAFSVGQTVTGDVDVTGNISASGTNRVEFGGAGSDTYIFEQAANRLDIVVGNTTFFALTGTFASVEAGVDFGVKPTRKIFLDGGVDTSIRQSAADVITLETGATDILQINASGLTVLTGDLTLADTINIVVNATTGTKIGTATSQKLAFYNSTPIVQPTALTAEDSTAIDSTYDSVEEAVLNNVRTRLGEVETKLQALGLLA